MAEFNPYAAPAHDVGMQPRERADGGLWRSGRLLVMDKTTPLPDACVVCAAPADGFTLRRRLFWHSRWWYLMILINLLVYVIVAMAVRRRADIRVGLCAAHRGRRRMWIALAWSLAVAAVALPFALAHLGDDAAAVVVAALPLLLLAAGLVGVYGARVVYPKRIDDEFAWIGGVSPALLATLPEWRGAAP